MAFEKTPRGSYGQKVPGLVRSAMKLLNPLMVRQARGKGRMGDMSLLVLTTTGAKTGQKRQTALGYFPDGENAWLIVASYGGNEANPAWYYNLAAHPETEIGLDGRTVAVTATQLSGDARDAAWQTIIATSPRYAGYETKTDRVIPVIRLTAS